MNNLGTCRDCGYEVSTSAKSCPGCGAPNPARKTRSVGTLVLYTVGGVLLLLLIFSGTGNRAPSIPTTAGSSGGGAVGASTFCQAIKDTDFEIVCQPNTSSRTIRLVMHADNSEAQKICEGAVAEYKKYSNSLAGWSLNIHTLYSGENVAATCHF